MIKKFYREGKKESIHIFSPKLCLSSLCVRGEHVGKYSTLYQCSERNLRHIFLSKLSLYFAKLIRYKIPLKTLSLNYFMVPAPPPFQRLRLRGLLKTDSI
jgi:hypothetical protein